METDERTYVRTDGRTNTASPRVDPLGGSTENRFPGLIGECEQLLRDYNIDDEEIVGVSKDAWKKKVFILCFQYF